MVYWVHPSTYIFTEGPVVWSNAAGMWHFYEYWVSPHFFMSLCLQMYIQFTLMLNQAILKSPAVFRRRNSFHSNTLKREGRNYVQLLLYVTGFSECYTKKFSNVCHNTSGISSALSVATNLTEVQQCLSQRIWHKFSTVCRNTSDRISATSVTAHLTEVQQCLSQHIWHKFSNVCHNTSDMSSSLSQHIWHKFRCPSQHIWQKFITVWHNTPDRRSAMSVTTHLTEVQDCLSQHTWHKFRNVCHNTSDRSSAISATTDLTEFDVFWPCFIVQTCFKLPT